MANGKRYIVYLPVDLVKELDDAGYWLRKKRSPMIAEAIRAYLDLARQKHFKGERAPAIPEE